LIGWFEAVVLGLVQGLTEFLPISSNAHVRIVSALFGWEDPGAAFTAVMQLGTESAVLVFFRRDIAHIINRWSVSLVRRDVRTDPAARLGWFVILGTIPIAVLGVLLKDPIETAFRDLRVIALALLLFSFVLGLADAVARNRLPLERLTVGHAALFGLAQSLALVPGVSRSGGTISAGLLLGYTREAATRYSFLLAIPAVLASGLFELREIGASEHVEWGPTVLATVIAFVVGYAVIRWLIRYVATHTFRPFVVERVVVAVLVLGLLYGGVIEPT
jgi:undecaprenyl-diphosphatase